MGQADPTTFTDPFNAISFLVNQAMNGNWTVTLGQVKSVTGGGVSGPATVNVQPMVNMVDGYGNATPHGIINNLPAFRLQGGTNGIVVDPVVGDIGIVAFASRDISSVIKNKAPANPGSLRTFDPADGIYIGGLLGAELKQYLSFTDTGVNLVDSFGNSYASTSSGVTVTDVTGNVISTGSGGIALTPKSGLPVTVTGNLIVTGNMQLEGNIESQTGGTYAGNISTSGNVIAGFGGADQIGLQTHTHTQGVDSHGDTEEPTSAPTAGT